MIFSSEVLLVKVFDETRIIAKCFQKFNELKQKVALALFKRGEFEKFYELAVLSELDPRMVMSSKFFTEQNSNFFAKHNFSLFLFYA